MTAKRFIEFTTQNTDNGEINNGFHDIKTGEWYHTIDNQNATKLCGLLNELHEELEPIKKICKKYRIPIKDLPEILEEYIAYDNDDEW